MLARAAQSAAKRPASGKDAKAKPGKGAAAVAAAVAAAAPPPIETVTPASAPVAAVAVPGAAASRADVIRSVIRELEHCRALLIGNVIAEASAGAKRSRAGGRT